MESGIISNVASALRIAGNKVPERSMFSAARRALAGGVLLCAAASGLADSASTPREGDYSVANSTLHYRTLGTPTHDETGLITNAILLLGGDDRRAGDFLSESMTAALFEPRQPLDASQYFLILPDAAGPVVDMVRLQYLLVLEHLGVNHLRMVVGHEAGGGQAWLWAGTYPFFVDALVVIDCLATQPPVLEVDRLAGVRAKAVAIVDADKLTPERLAILQDEIARLKHGRYLIVHPDPAGAGALSMVRQWKVILPELLEVPENQ